MKRYSLEALKSVREHAVAERRQQLAESFAAVSAAEGVHKTAKRELVLERERLAEEMRREMRRADAGLAKVSDFHSAEPFRVHCEARVESAARSVEAAERALRAALGAKATAEQELAKARAEVKLLERHREHFVEQQRLHQEMQVEELAVDAWAAVRRNRGSEN